MPFGITNAPATYKRLMNCFNRPHVRQCLDLFTVDDVLVFAETFDKLLSRLRLLLERLCAAGLCSKPSNLNCLRQVKCTQGTSSKIKSLRQIKKIVKEAEWPTPRTGGDIALFLGLCNFYRELISYFAEITNIFYELVEPEHLKWTRSMDKAFRRLKEAFKSEPIV